MAEVRAIEAFRCLINGLPFMAEVEGYTPPEVKKKMEETRGGRFVVNKIMTGLEAMEGQLTLIGATDEMLLSFGVEVDSYSEITVLASSLDQQKNKIPLRWEHTCEVTNIKSETIKGGLYKHTIDFTCRAFKHMDNGKIIHDIDEPTMKAVIFGKDHMEKHRANLEM
ncbi:phage major tail tube protein [Oceanospirillum sediminis]|uniref:Phage major tail tube protein n=1 Tax=Oceanospirillum sediminis TaxID=2760088 RepID=A0A839IVJ8_9GAMM|nr:phage major tail tube protein [Oceanospirillum sediminis]MBB1489375.1 phage major tail tube protein [Oceanospirillum sediminis]